MGEEADGGGDSEIELGSKKKHGMRVEAGENPTSHDCPGLWDERVQV